MSRRFVGWLSLTLVAGCEHPTDRSRAGTVPPAYAVGRVAEVSSTQIPVPCSGCLLAPTVFTRRARQDAVVREFPGDPQADYVLIVQDDGKDQTGAEIKLNDKTVVARSALQRRGISELKVGVRLGGFNRLTVLPLGNVGASITVWILSGAKELGPAGGIVTAPGSSATVTVPVNVITSGALLVQLTDTFGVTGPYPVLADRGYRLTFTAAPATTFGMTGEVQVSLPLTRPLAAGEKAIASAVIDGSTYWVSGSVATITSSPALSFRTAVAAQPQFTFALPAPLLATSTSIPGTTALSTPAIVLPQYLSLAAVTCSPHEYPRSSWVGGPPLGRDPNSKSPVPGDVGIVLVHGWDRELADCTYFATRSLPGEVYFEELVGGLRSEFSSAHPLWAFTYPSFYPIARSGAELRREIERLITNQQLSGVIIVAHSMGGLVSRLAAQELQKTATTKDRLLGIVTLGTMHLGVPWADPMNPAFKIVNSFPYKFFVDSPGLRDLGLGLQSNLIEEVPLLASSGDIRGANFGMVDNFLKLLDEEIYLTIDLRSDGIVPTYSASPTFITRGKAYPPLQYDHYELHKGDDEAGLFTDPLYQRMFADIRRLASQSTVPGWEFRRPMPSVLTRMGVGVVGGKVYLLGGYINGPVTPNWAYDPTTDSWDLSNMGWPCGAGVGDCIAGAQAAVFGGLVYLVGGHDFWGPVAHLRVYDPVANQWSSRTPMPVAGSPQLAGFLGGQLYVVVATAAPGPTGSGRSDLLVYEPTADSWNSLGQTPLPHHGGTGGIIGSRLFLIGGSDASGSLTQELNIYDPFARAWTTGAALPTPRFDAASAVAGDKLFVAGGRVPGSSFCGWVRVVEAYDARRILGLRCLGCALDWRDVVPSGWLSSAGNFSRSGGQLAAVGCQEITPMGLRRSTSRP